MLGVLVDPQKEHHEAIKNDILDLLPHRDEKYRQFLNQITEI